MSSNKKAVLISLACLVVVGWTILCRDQIAGHKKWIESLHAEQLVSSKGNVTH